MMKTFTYVITDRVGIHARPAGIVVKAAQKFQSEIMVFRGDAQADAKKLMRRSWCEEADAAYGAGREAWRRGPRDCGRRG